MKTKLSIAKNCLIASIFILPTTALADLAGVEVGVGAWNHDLSGDIRYHGDNISDDELGFSSKTEAYTWIRVEHPIPIVPNIKLKFADVSFSGSSTLSNNITFGNKTFSGDINSDASLSQYDLALYYEILDNWVNLDLGLNFKYIDGSFTINNSAQSETGDFSGVVPQLYVNGRFDLPFTGLSATFEGRGVTYSGSQLTDFEAKASYELSIGIGLEAVLGVEGGWRHERFNVDTDDVDTNFTISGPFGGAYLRASLF
jgi:outer membrane protein